MQKIIFILTLGVAFLARPLAAQEFNCSVSVNYQALSGSEFTYLDELRERVDEYINQHRWTDELFESHERIDCSMQIVMTEAVSTTRFKARLVVASRRPIYGSSLQTPVVRFSDEQWLFDYTQGSPLTFDPDRFHAVTSVLDFYAFLMLGYDFDTFSELGGTPYFEQARRIYEIAQSSGAIGWSSIGGDQTRGTLITQILDQRFRALREAYFDYHYGSLDHFLEDPVDARETMLDVVENLAGMRDDVTRSFILDQFFSVKSSEIVEVFQNSQQAIQAYNLLSQIDPSHLSEYSQLSN